MPGSDEVYQRYHDNEWGHPVADDFRLFEKICLEGFQSGLSWLTILRKRESFRSAFHQFDAARIARYTEKDIVRLSGSEPAVAKLLAKARALPVTLAFEDVAAIKKLLARAA